MPVLDDFGFEDAAALLALLDMSKGDDLDIKRSGLRLHVTCWRSAVTDATSHDVGPSSEAALAPEAHIDRSENRADSTKRPMRILAEAVGVYHAAREGGVESESRRTLAAEERLGVIKDHKGQASPVVCPVRGELVDLCVRDGDFVDYGQTIAMVTPAAGNDDVYASG